MRKISKKMLFKRQLLVFFICALFVVGQTPLLLAQDSSDQGDAQSGHKLFLPLIGATANNAQADEPATTEPLAAVDGAISPLNSQSVTKSAAVSAAGHGAGPLKPVSLIVTFDQSVTAEKLQAATGGKIIHRYTHVFNGASLVTTDDKAATLAHIQGVTGVYVDHLVHPDTDVSPHFIGADAVWQDLGGQESAGDNVTVGVIDTGIWPEHASFSDPDPSGKAYMTSTVVPGSHGFVGDTPRSTCDFGNTAANPNDVAFTCNNKLIGAYTFLDTYKAVIGLTSAEFDSARDDEGHGTHTASTSAGNGNVAASIFGVPRGLVSGIAPRAHVIAYRVLAAQGGFDSDIIAAIEQAVLDQVNVINYSIGTSSFETNPYNDATALAFLNAYNQGVFVAASAGNSGPGPDTVDNIAPWVTTVAASTSDRHFFSTLTVSADNGDQLTLTGASITNGISQTTPVVFSPDPLCNPLPENTFHGEIVICNRGVNARVEKSFNVAQAGGSGMILRNLQVQDIETDNHFIPSIHLDGPAGTQLVSFMGTHTGVMATFTQGQPTQVKGDVMASFSSRGGPGQSLGISKPDLTAPGVQILAGNTPFHSEVTDGKSGELFQAIAGTSMSSPHVAGAAALLKALHPDWTPGQIKSALMTTGKTQKVYKEDGHKRADNFDDGSGRIDLNVAGNPGLTFDESGANYEAFKDALWNANYPSFYHPSLPGSITVQRTAKDVTGQASEWTLTTDTDRSDWSITVPEHITVPANGQATFAITINAGGIHSGLVRHGSVFLTNGAITLHLPISFVRDQAIVTYSKHCWPSTVRVDQLSRCTITAQNTSFSDAVVNLTDQIPSNLALVPLSVVGADVTGNNQVGYTGTLAAAQPPAVSAVVTSTASPAGYLSLAAFPSTIVVNAGDESIANFTGPNFVYAGEIYSRLGIVSNGYIVAGGGADTDIKAVNTALPNPDAPNNVLAPFWTDLNPGAGGRELINVLSDGTDSWIVVEWENVPNFTDGITNTFQVWIGVNGVEDISYVYGSQISAGDFYEGIHHLTVGAENKFGNSGAAVYYNGTGTTPASSDSGYEVDVNSIPGEPGATHKIVFKVKGVEPGNWQNCAEMTSDLFQGTSIACIKGRVK